MLTAFARAGELAQDMPTWSRGHAATPANHGTMVGGIPAPLKAPWQGRWEF
jgi:hypothetical protein